MANEVLGILLQDPRLRIPLELLANLSGNVGDGPAEVPIPELAAEDAQLSLFDQVLNLDARLGASLEILGGDAAAADPFGSQGLMGAPAGMRLGRLWIEGEFGASTGAATTSGTFALSASGSAGGRFHYLRLLPLSPNRSRLEGFRSLVAGSRLPQSVPLDGLEAGELHRFRSTLNLQLGLEVRWGAELEVEDVLHLFDGFAPQLAAHAHASAQAALGWSLYEEMELIIGRASTLHDDWVRVRLARADEQRLTFGATVGLRIEYDLATSLEAILQRSLDQQPLQRSLEALRRVATEDWDSLKEELIQGAEDRATATLVELLDGTGWRDWVRTSDDQGQRTELGELMDGAKRLLDAYDRLGSTAQSLWDELLGSADLGPDSTLRRQLMILAGIDAESLDPVGWISNPELQRNVRLLEALSGHSLEEILLAPGGEARRLLAQAQGVAARALGFLDTAPQRLLARIGGYAQRLGIRKTLDLLRAHGSSRQALEASIDAAVQPRIRALVSRLLGKAWESVEDEEVRKVQSWAQDVTDHFDRLEARVRGAIERLRGEVGVSLSFELDRVTRTQALVDLELDPSSAGLRSAIQGALARGDAAQLLAALPTQKKRDEPLAYQLRESLLSYHRTRSRTFSQLVSFLGAESVSSRRVEEYNLRFSTVAERLQRTAYYGGGFVSNSQLEGIDLESGTWLEVRAEDAPAAFDAPLNDVEAGLRLTFGYRNPELEDQDLGRLKPVLQTLQLEGVLDDLGLPPGSQLRLAVELYLPQAAVAALAFTDQGGDHETTWNRSYADAAARWFDEMLIRKTLHGHGQRLAYPTLAAIARRQDFRREWVDGIGDFASWVDEHDAFTRGKSLTVGNQKVEAELLRPRQLGDDRPINQKARWNSSFHPIFELVESRPRALQAAAHLHQRLATALNGWEPDDAWSLARGAADQLRDMVPAARLQLQNQSWPNPLFLVWLVLGRTVLLAPESLAQVRGLAILRSKPPTDDDPATEGQWSEPKLQALSGGLDAGRLREGLGLG
ncbi:MAG: hypothetical protein SX243_15630 [Acidobacteriota bacterium]|nr:hypothetical protein [Acidobacteriota bacterium]